MVETAPPRITLRNYFSRPYDSAMAAARTCYSATLVTPDQITDKQRVNIGAATFEAGHHTVYQHAHFEFGLENVSRQFVWSFLHSHPFYNSEQQSQRYVRMDRVQAFVPPLTGEARQVYEAAIARAWDSYRELSELLKPETHAVLADIWQLEESSHERRQKKVSGQAEKKAIEIARYVLPIAAFTNMVHTLSGITLHRLWRMQRSGDTPHEASLVVREMVARVREADPAFFDRIGKQPLADEQLPEWPFLEAASKNGTQAVARNARAEFDAQLNGRVSTLLDYSAHAERVTAQAVRAVLGKTEAELSDDAALDLLLNPAKNRYRLETLNVGVHSPLMRALQHATYTFAKRISHTADSQDQRHRMVPASRPLLLLTDSSEPDYITPMLVRRHARAREVFDRAMASAWEAKSRLLALGVRREFALYLLPNATAVRLVESGPLLHLLHKWTMRTCFNAQEEIYQASMEEVEQVARVHPRLMRYVGPPCVVRAGITQPICTEGSHFCGIKVWEDFPRITRRI
ncbi:MAG: FAD-dependent thymidylate synthase [Acidobacteria bacterium]|nr:FAD-dependent thymidylate synthase [Acidobacteriota bacterium]